MESTTGLELELLCPPGMTRLDLLERLRPVVGGTLRPFDFPSKVPVPRAPAGLRGVDVVAWQRAAMEDVARHHGARLHSLHPDGRHFYLAHPAARLVDGRGRTLLEVVHDNTIAGGMRVAELITPPFRPRQLPQLTMLLQALRGVRGLRVPPRGALHVHVGARGFRTAWQLWRLAALYTRHESLLRRWLRTPAAFHAARPLPPMLLDLLWAGAEQPLRRMLPVLQRCVEDNRCGLNLFNVIHQRRDKPTVELKLARGTLDVSRVLAVRALFVAMVEWSVTGRDDVPRTAAALRRVLDPGGAFIPALQAVERRHRRP